LGSFWRQLVNPSARLGKAECRGEQLLESSDGGLGMVQAPNVPGGHLGASTLLPIPNPQSSNLSSIIANLSFGLLDWHWSIQHLSAKMASSVDEKLLKATKFPPEFNRKVDMKKVNVEVIKK
jgi:hypothetical protein